MKKLLLILMSISISLCTFANHKVVDVKKAGSFPDYISDWEKYNIDSITVSGPLNGTDIGWLRDMAGSSINGRKTNGSLRYIDMTNAKIVEGGSFYFDGEAGGIHHITCYTANDTIGPSMFAKCNKLERILLPNTAKTTDARSFESCENLKSVVIPNSFEAIGWYSFDYCTKLESIDIPNSIRKIEAGAFISCALVNVTIPNSVTQIDNDIFLDCDKLRSVVLPDNLETIPSRMFGGCSNLRSITIPNSVTTIEDLAFMDCAKLTSIDLPSSLTTIGSTYSGGTFMRCRSLESINLPNTVTLLKSDSFSGCSSLKSVNISNSITEIEENMFKDCTSLKTVTIPNSITNIGRSAFEHCENLVSLYISESLIQIEDKAFYYCRKLNDIYINATVPPRCINDPFELVRKTVCALHVPTNCKSSYTSANLWKDFDNILEFGVTGIDDIKPDNNKIIQYYTIDGIPLKAPIHGINIVKMSDGTAKKVFIK